MKKILIGLIIVIGLIFIGVISTNNNSNDNTTSSYTDNTASGYDDSSSTNDADKEMQDYLKEVLPYVRDLEDEINTIGELSIEGSNNPPLLLDYGFKSDVNEVCDNLRNTIYDIQDMRVSDDAKVQKLHNYLLNAVHEWEYVSATFPVGIETLNSSMIRSSASHMENGKQYIQQAENLLDEYSNNY